MSILELETKRPMIAFRVASIPQPKGSLRAFLAKGRPVLTSTTTGLKGWEALVRSEAQRHVSALMTEAVHCDLRFILPRPQSLPKRRYSWPTRKPDVDKLARAVLDALTGVAWQDDAQVTTLHCQKRYAQPAEQPGVWVTLNAVQTSEVGE